MKKPLTRITRCYIVRAALILNTQAVIPETPTRNSSLRISLGQFQITVPSSLDLNRRKRIIYVRRRCNFRIHIQLDVPSAAAKGAYGFRWQAGQGVPNQISIYDLNAGVGPGIYVVFQPTALAGNVDLFGRLGVGAPGPVFPAPANPSAAVTDLINRVRKNPPTNEGPYF